MRILADVCKVLMWVVLALSLFFQIGAIMAIKYFDNAMGIRSSYEVGPLAAATALMTVAVIMFAALRRGKGIPLIAAAVLGVCFIALAHSLHSYYGAPAGTEQIDDYMTVWEALYKHALPALLPVLMLPIWLVYREDRRAADLAAELEALPSILGDLSDFTLSTLPEEKEVPKPTKKRKQ